MRIYEAKSKKFHQKVRNNLTFDKLFLFIETGNSDSDSIIDDFSGELDVQQESPVSSPYIPTRTSTVRPTKKKVVKKVNQKKKQKKKPVEPVKVRTKFPETWLWVDEKIGLVLLKFGMIKINELEKAAYEAILLLGYDLLENRMCSYKILRKLSWKI